MGVVLGRAEGRTPRCLLSIIELLRGNGAEDWQLALVIMGRRSALAPESAKLGLPRDWKVAPVVHRLAPTVLTYREDEIRIGVGDSIERTVILKVGAVAESIDL
jgi:hypothetical protein